jgi:hypothetical protein
MLYKSKFVDVFCVRQVSELKVSRQMIEKKAEEDRITAAKVTKQKAEKYRITDT